MDLILGIGAFMGALSLLGWAVLVAGVIAIVIGVELERYSVSFAAVIIAFVALTLLSGSNFGAVWSAIVADPGLIIKYIFYYLAIGVVWAFAKWFFFLFKVRDALKDYREKHDIKGAMTEDQRRDFLSWSPHYSHRQYGNSTEVTPQAKHNKQRIVGWMTWWPFSMPWTLINDPIKRLFDFIYRRIVSVFQAMSDQIFKGLT